MHLPRGRHFAVTWGIPDNFGGMTAALLHRSRAFVHAGTAVDILTFDLREDYEAVRSDLRERGELIDGMRVLNLWEWLRTHPIPAGSVRHTREPGALQVDHYRADGTLAVSDRRDVRERGVPGGRSIVLRDAHGNPVRSFGRAWALYRWWLDQLTEGERSFLIVDSKTSANFMATYHRPFATVVHVVHNSHLDPATNELRASRRRVFENLDTFDGVVLLSESQRRDLAPRANLSVIPNSRDLPAPAQGPREGVVVLASLTRRKRVDHAVRAAVRAGVRLDVYGEGELRPALERLDGDGLVTFHGHVPDARDRLSTASAILLTADAEGFPLALVESMAAGCIPIAYDVRYGPADIIRDRVNGFLVPPGDEEALAAALAEFLALPPGDQQRMRAAARRSAARFSDRVVTLLWSRQLRRSRRLRLSRRLHRAVHRSRWSPAALSSRLRRAARPS